MILNSRAMQSRDPLTVAARLFSWLNAYRSSCSEMAGVALDGLEDRVDEAAAIAPLKFFAGTFHGRHSLRTSISVMPKLPAQAEAST